MNGVQLKWKLKKNNLILALLSQILLNILVLCIYDICIYALYFQVQEYIDNK